MLKRLSIDLIVIAIIIGCGIGVYFTVPVKAEPLTVVKEVYVTEIVEVPTYIEVPVEVIREVEIIKTVEVVKQVETVNIIETNKLRDWNSVEELKTWLDKNFTIIYKQDSSGVIDFAKPTVNHCVDYAQRLQYLASRDGYFLSLALVKDGQYYFTQVLDAKLYYAHMGNFAVVGNEGYFVDYGLSKIIVKVTDLR
jgi:hypothetical protein